MTNAWAQDVADGHDTALLAWRRDDVRDLNRLARDVHRDQLRVTGPEVIAPGGRPYAAGDQVVLLAPNPEQGLVTSERLVVSEVDVVEGRVRAVTAGGRSVELSGEAIDDDHIDHGYALTVHRAQGATYDRAHVLANGGGRELAYVALSRARTGTTLHAIADDLPQLRHDLALGWSEDRGQRWIKPVEPDSGPYDQMTQHPMPSFDVRSGPIRNDIDIGI